MTDYSKFNVPVTVFRNGKHNVPDVDAVAFCFFTAKELHTEIPAGQLYSTREDGTQKNLSEYVGAGSYDAGWYRLCPIHFPIGRVDVFACADLDIWNMFLTPRGKGVDTWRTQAEHFAACAAEQTEL